MAIQYADDFDVVIQINRDLHNDMLKMVDVPYQQEDELFENVMRYLHPIIRKSIPAEPTPVVYRSNSAVVIGTYLDNTVYRIAIVGKRSVALVY